MYLLQMAYYKSSCSFSAIAFDLCNYRLYPKDGGKVLFSQVTTKGGGGYPWSLVPGPLPGLWSHDLSKGGNPVPSLVLSEVLPQVLPGGRGCYPNLRQGVSPSQYSGVPPDRTGDTPWTGQWGTPLHHTDM